MAETTVKSRKKAPVSEVVPEVTYEEPTYGIIAIDNGGYNTKVFTEDMDKPIVMESQKGIGHSKGRLFQGTLPDGSYDVKWNGKHYFFGSLLKESKRKLTSYTNSKATDYFTLSALLAVAIHGYDINSVVTCVPYKRYTETEKEAVREKLVGEHTLFIDGQEYHFTIEDVVVMSEVLVTSYEYDTDEVGTIRWIDLGSRTIGYATSRHLEDGSSYVDNDASDTIEREGLEITKIIASVDDGVMNFDDYVSSLADNLLPIFSEDETVKLTGGGALVEDLVKAIQEVFPNAEAVDDPLTAQVRGMLRFGIDYFEGGEDE